MTVFADEWRRCLRAHYMHAIRHDDRVNLRSLVPVLQHLGFTDAELAELRVQATMHVDDVGEDFVPDLDVLQAQPEIEPEAQPQPQPPQGDFQPHPLECQCPRCVEINLVPHDEDGQPIEAEDDEHDDPDAPQQLSLF